ncbi:MAG: hypothetical protein A3G91_04810 [Omnitrophica WOR_2 bacterium RIFCSPLOWO2_12_FULL_50_9]|nr:MAG: hypothetical protein A3D87_06065 [Omnitrophica WOR_2 bacterium RIFCSPHIGHO2_02_FULL_50_17]OGX41455.1 MAG: hypothetical protein A3G91_04810 [Omnitrophica WOR_2 bacterium RIFCSPLOWO2_12_FULL_50_9]
MNIVPDKRLFWFLKDSISLDLSNNADLELYVQHVLSRGRMEDVKTLLATVDFKRFKQIFSKIKRFFPWEVGRFWEDFIATY